MCRAHLSPHTASHAVGRLFGAAGVAAPLTDDVDHTIPGMFRAPFGVLAASHAVGWALGAVGVAATLVLHVDHSS